jgi:hypothetical protein
LLIPSANEGSLELEYSLNNRIKGFHQSGKTKQNELNHLLADGQLFAQDHVQAAQLGLRIEAIESELMQALQRWETLGNR